MIGIQQTRVDVLVSKLAHDDLPGWRAIDELAIIGEPAVSALNAVLAGTNAVHSGAAERALSRIGGAAVPALIALFETADTPLREKIVNLLLEIRDARAVPLFIACLPTQSEVVQLYILRVLGIVGGETASDYLLSLLHDPAFPLRGGAASALGWLRDVRAFDMLLHIALTDELEITRASAWGALGRLGDLRAFDAMLAASIGPWSFATEFAAEALGHLGDSRAVPALRELLRGSYQSMRWVAAEALGRLDVNAAREALDDSDVRVRYHACKGIAASKATQKLEITLSFLFDSELLLRQQSELNLVDLGGIAVEALTALLSHPKPAVRCRIVSIVGRIREESAVARLVDACSDKNAAVRREAVIWLRHQSVSTIPVLTQRLQLSGAGMRRVESLLVDACADAYRAQVSRGLPGNDAPDLAPLRVLEDDPNLAIRAKFASLHRRIVRADAEMQMFWAQVMS